MLVDEEAHSVAPYENAASLRPDRKTKSKEMVGSISFLLLFRLNNTPFQPVPDCRTEVKLLDFLNIPGITPSRELTKGQKAVLVRNKKAKCDHPTHSLLPCGKSFSLLRIKMP